MILTTDIKKYINQSVLCWLATVSSELQPNVSPKEIFTIYGEEHILIANIASPRSVRNMKQNPKVCISFIDILVQKGYQLKGTARIIGKKHPEFEVLEPVLLELTGGKFPFATITKITIESAKPILAPRYLLFPESTTEASQIESARKAYEV